MYMDKSMKRMVNENNKIEGDDKWKSSETQVKV